MMTEKPKLQKSPVPTVVFFDGICHLCNSFVDWVMVRDPQGRFQFAPLQGTTAERILSPDQRQALDSIRVCEDGRILQKSSAVLYVLARLPGWGWTGVFKCIPRFMRDFVYDIIAHYRYGWFGQRDSCRIPTTEERDRLLP